MVGSKVIDAKHTRADLSSKRQPALLITTVDTGTETKITVIHHGQSVGNLDNGRDGSKEFFLENAHIRRHVAQSWAQN
jgi:hypothetical protein